MKPEEFKAWRKEMGFSQAAAAKALGVSKGSVENYDRGHRIEDKRPAPVPRPVELACAALAAGLTGWVPKANS